MDDVTNVTCKWFWLDIKNYNEDDDLGYFVEVDVQHFKQLD